MNPKRHALTKHAFSSQLVAYEKEYGHHPVFEMPVFPPPEWGDAEMVDAPSKPSEQDGGFYIFFRLFFSFSPSLRRN